MQSRLTRVRDQRESRQAIGLIVVTVLFLGGFLFWGLPAMAGLVGNLFIHDGNVGTEAITIKPTPPVLSDIPEATKSASVDITGFAQPGLQVVLYVNTSEFDKILVSDAGTFVFAAVPLTEGENQLYAEVVGRGEVKSEPSRTYTVIVDTTNPTLVVETPQTGTVYHTERERVVTISGSVGDDVTKVYVGERMAIVKPDKKFSMAYQLVEGDQTITVKATDEAGNETSQDLTLRWER